MGSFNTPASTATWTVTAPRTGSYRLNVLAGANGSPGEHALFVDGAFVGLIHYSADLGWQYRGDDDITFPLAAGTHSLSVRASQDGNTVLPGADITLDRFDLYDVTGGVTAIYPANDARLSGGAILDYSNAASAGFAKVTPTATATFFTAGPDTGYYDVTVHYATSGVSAVTLLINGQRVALPRATKSGTWASTARVYLPQGITEISATASAGALIGDVTTTRGPSQVATDANPAVAVRIGAASLNLSGNATTTVLPPSSGSNGVADTNGNVTQVTNIGNDAQSTVSFSRPNGFGAGQYVMTVNYANAERDNGINYNPQVVTRFLDVTETGGATTRAPFRHNYSWNSFWDKSFPMSLTTAAGAITLGNTTGAGPDLDQVTLAKLVAGSPTTSTFAIASTVQHAFTTGVPAANGWYTTPVAVTLLSNSTNATIQFQLDNGSWRNYQRSFVVATDGQHVVQTRLDQGGATVTGSATSFTVDLDTTAALIKGVRSPANGVGTPRNPVILTFISSDPTSGVASVQYAVNSGGWQQTTAGSTVSFTAPGTYVVAFRVTNGAGLTSVIASSVITINADPATVVKASTAKTAAGAYVTWTLAGFHRFTAVTLTHGSTVVANAVTDQNGAAQVTAQLPSAAPVGAYTVTATEAAAATGLSATTTIRVVPAA